MWASLARRKPSPASTGGPGSTGCRADDAGPNRTVAPSAATVVHSTAHLVGFIFPLINDSFCGGTFHVDRPDTGWTRKPTRCPDGRRGYGGSAAPSSIKAPAKAPAA